MELPVKQKMKIVLNSFFKKTYFYSPISLCVCVCVARHPWGPEEGTGSLGHGVMCGCELLNMGLGN